MASGKGHLIGGFIFIIIFIHIISHYFFQPTLIDIILYIAIGLMFAVWPDVDIKSIGQKFFYSIDSFSSFCNCGDKLLSQYE